MPIHTPHQYSLHPRLDLDEARAKFAAERRVQLSPFLSDADADLLSDHLAEREDWYLVVNSGPQVVNISPQQQAALSPQQREQLEEAVVNGGRHGFQFRYHSIKVSDAEGERRGAGDLLNDFALWLSSAPVVAALHHITAARDVCFADAQATRYGPGHFLTAHNDSDEVKQRRVAYVLSLTRDWRAKWGGLLLFHAPDGSIERGYVPKFNTLSLFAVPQVHSVSWVTPMADGVRHSVTGWFRGRAPG
jgi:Rps23 Pro-64 3,4-dihydroxylase Tpa1-like proline 4-hydroxylase